VTSARSRLRAINVGMTSTACRRRPCRDHLQHGPVRPGPGAAQNEPMGCWFGYLSIESCVSDAVHVAAGAGLRCSGSTLDADTEGVGGNDISDPSRPTGTVTYSTTQRIHPDPVVNGAAN